MVTPTVTILMPVFNASQYLREAIDSILYQTFANFEFLIIDDGSTDDSVSIIRSYSDPRIRLILNEKNVGISETLNRGINLAKCDLIARMDADDISLPTRIQKQLVFMIAHPDCALLSTWARVVTEEKTFVRLERYRSEYYYFNLTFECWIYHPTIMFRRGAVKEVGMYSKAYSEDYDLFWKLSVKYRIANLCEELLYYRLSPTSLNTVLKKQDYHLANEENVVRNIRYYLGDQFSVKKSVLECLRHNFQLIVENFNIPDALEALRIVDRVADRMVMRKNPNCSEAAIKGARFFKRRFMITELVKALPAHQGINLLLLTQEWYVLYALSLNSMKWRLKKIKSFLFSMA